MTDTLTEELARAIVPHITDRRVVRRFFGRRAIDKSCGEVIHDIDPDGPITDESYVCVERVDLPNFQGETAANERAQVLGDEWSAAQIAAAILPILTRREEAARAAGAADWRSMDSAPRDGTDIDVWVEGEFPRRLTNVSWREPSDSEWWVHGGDTIETPDATWHDVFGPLGQDDQPTAWMPLPSPPQSGA